MANVTDAPGVRSVRTALDVLEVVAFAREEIGVTHISDRLGLTKGSVHRHLQTLVERGYLAQNPATSRYSIGAKTNLLSHLAPEVDILYLAEGPMREIRDHHGHSTVLSSMTPGGALVMVTIPGMAAIEIGVRPGSELSFHASAQGKVMLAFAPPSLQARVLSAPRERFTSYTIIDAPRIEEDLAQIREAGYCIAPEETLLGINAVAAPIFDSSSACIASIALVGSIQNLTASPSAELLHALTACAHTISRKLGYEGRGVFHPPMTPPQLHHRGGGTVQEA